MQEGNLRSFGNLKNKIVETLVELIKRILYSSIFMLQMYVEKYNRYFCRELTKPRDIIGLLYFRRSYFLAESNASRIET